MKISPAGLWVFSIAAAILLASIASASAQMLDMTVWPEERAVNAGNHGLFEVTVKNDYPRYDEYYLYVAGSPTTWVNINSGYLIMEPKSSRMVKIDFYPNDVPGTYAYDVILKSVNDPSLVNSKRMTLRVLGQGKDKVSVLSHQVSQGKDGIDVTLGVSSNVEKSIIVDYSIASESGITVTTETLSFQVSGQKTITHTIPLPKNIVAGAYDARIQVREAGFEFKSRFEIQPVHGMVRADEQKSSPLFHEYVITLSNEGNVIEKDFKLVSSIPTGFVTFSQQPTMCGEKECEWVLSKLNPDESIRIIYRVEYWPLFLEGLVIAVLLGSFIFFGVRRATTPTISKRIESKGTGSYAAVLEIRNPGKRMNNVIVREKVPPLFSVDDSFESVRPDVTRTDQGTDLVWSLPNIESKDHRILHYNMKPMVSGHIRVPGATMKYFTTRGKKKRVRTRESLISAPAEHLESSQ